MSENEREFRRLVAGLKIDTEPDAAHRERLRRQMLQTFEEAARPSAGKTHPPATTTVRLWSTSIVKLAVAAAVLVAATVAVWIWLGPTSGPMTFNQVRLATKKMPWLYAAVSRYQNNEVQAEQYWCNFEAKKAYAAMDDGTLLAWDYGAGRKQFAYSPHVRTLVISELPQPGPFGADSAYNLVDALSVFVEKDNVQVDTWTTEHEGKTAQAYGIEVVPSEINIDGQPAARLRIAITAEPQTKRIVAANTEYRGADGNLLAREEWAMSYPQSGPGSIFDLGVPANARVFDRTRQPIGTPGEGPTPISTPAPTGNSGLIPLEISLPKPMFAGTPQNGRVPNLEKPRKSPRPPFLAPAGTTNLALGKPVSSSDPEPVIGSLDLITDGDKEAMDGSFVELGPEPQYVTIDLQEMCEIYAVVVWHHHRWPRVYFDVVVQISTDRTFHKGVQTVFNNDMDDSLGLGAGTDLNYTETNEGKLIDCRGIQGRYVRLYSNGNSNDDLNHYTEVEVYGRP